MIGTKAISAFRPGLACVWLSILVVVGFVAFSSGPADDSYIVARYAFNAHAGLGPVFNAGERINALTSPGELLVYFLLMFGVADPVPVYQVIAVLAVVSSATFVAFRLLQGARARLFFLALVLGSPFTIFWTVGGLETPLLYVCALALSALIVNGALESRPQALAATIVGMTMVFLRYDASLLVVPALAPLIFKWRRDRVVVTTAISCGAIFAGWLLFCRSYYGDFLPTSFYIKLSDSHVRHAIAGGALYLLSFLVLSLSLIALPATRRKAVAIRQDPLLMGVWAGVAFSLAYGIFAGTVHMMYAYRFFVPLIPVIWLLEMVVRRRTAGSRPIAWSGVFGVLVIQSVLAFTVYWYSQNPNLSLLAARQSPHDEKHEFSTVGSRYTENVLHAVRLQAGDIASDWKGQPEHVFRAPRISVEAGGMLPFLLPGTYIYEKLVSYRHRCRFSLIAGADYRQVFRLRTEAGQSSSMEPGVWSLVSAYPLDISGLYGPTGTLVMELWRQSRPLLVIPPTTVNGPCIVNGEK